MEVWDFLHNHEVPILNIKVADSALNCLKVVHNVPLVIIKYSTNPPQLADPRVRAAGVRGRG